VRTYSKILPFFFAASGLSRAYFRSQEFALSGSFRANCRKIVVRCRPFGRELRPKITRLAHPQLGALCLESIGLDQSERWRAHADDTLLVQVPVAGTGTVEALQRAMR
jgi:hypothetical protein